MRILLLKLELGVYLLGTTGYNQISRENQWDVQTTQCSNLTKNLMSKYLLHPFVFVKWKQEWHNVICPFRNKWSWLLSNTTDTEYMNCNKAQFSYHSKLSIVIYIVYSASIMINICASSMINSSEIRIYYFSCAVHPDVPPLSLRELP